MSLEAEVIGAVRARIESEREEAEDKFNNAKYMDDEQYEQGRAAAFDYALQIIKTELGRRGLE